MALRSLCEFRGPRAALGLASALVLAGCATVAPPAAEPAIPDDCPAAPPPMSRVEQISLLSRFVRETRANLMTRVLAPRSSSATDSRPAILATLHPPRLALIEAILAQPREARAQDGAWLREHLLQTYVELRSRWPLALDGALEQLALEGENGTRHPALYLSQGTDGDGFVARIYFVPPPQPEQRALTRWSLALPLAGGLVARWGVPSQPLDASELLPIAFDLRPLRKLRLARWALLAGEVGRGRRMADEVLRCSPALAAARVLAQAGARMTPHDVAPDGAAPDGAAPDGDAVAGGSAAGAAHGAHLRRRQAVARLLGPAARAGLVSGVALQRALTTLAGGGRDATALHAFDRALAALLVDALDPLAPLAPAATVGGLESGAPASSTAGARAALARRVALANAALEPQLIVPERRHGLWADLDQVQPRLIAKVGAAEVIGRASTRVGDAWIHPGMPPLSYRMELVDRSQRYWAGRVDGLADAAALQRVGREILEHELRGPDPRAVALAARGLIARRGQAAWSLLLPVVNHGGPQQAAAVLRAMGALAGDRVASLARQFARSPEAKRRAAALSLAAGLVGQQGLLLAGLDDPAPEVAETALGGLLRARKPQAVKRARDWLVGTDGGRRAAALRAIAAAGPAAAALRADLLALLDRGVQTPALIGALGRVGGPRVLAALARLYRASQPARREVLAAASGTPFAALLRVAARDPDGALRRLAVRRLAALPHPPRRALEAALADDDAGVRLAAHVGLARLGRSESMLALGSGARASCDERALVITPLSAMLDVASRRSLLLDALNTPCAEVHSLSWRAVVRHQASDPALLRAGMRHPARWLRVQAALTALGSRDGAALGQIP